MAENGWFQPKMAIFVRKLPEDSICARDNIDFRNPRAFAAKKHPLAWTLQCNYNSQRGVSKRVFSKNASWKTPTPPKKTPCRDVYAVTGREGVGGRGGQAPPPPRRAKFEKSPSSSAISSHLTLNSIAFCLHTIPIVFNTIALCSFLTRTKDFHCFYFILCFFSNKKIIFVACTR